MTEKQMRFKELRKITRDMDDMVFFMYVLSQATEGGDEANKIIMEKLRRYYSECGVMIESLDKS